VCCATEDLELKDCENARARSMKVGRCDREKREVGSSGAMEKFRVVGVVRFAVVDRME
jgi:hypothetical protein